MLGKFEDIDYLERTPKPYAKSYPDDFVNNYKEDKFYFIHFSMSYNNRYIRLAINPLFIEDDEEKAGKLIMDAVKRIIKEEE